MASCNLTRMVQIATNPFGYRVHAGAVLLSYAPDNNQATLKQYHISDYNINLAIIRSYGSVVGSIFRHSHSVFKQINTAV
jgi:hypothetical protein